MITLIPQPSFLAKQEAFNLQRELLQDKEAFDKFRSVKKELPVQIKGWVDLLKFGNWQNLNQSSFPLEEANELKADWESNAKKLLSIKSSTLYKTLKSDIPNFKSYSKNDLISFLIYKQIVLPTIPKIDQTINKHLEDGNTEGATLFANWVFNRGFGTRRFPSSATFKVREGFPQKSTFLEMKIRQQFPEVVQYKRKGCCIGACNTCGRRGLEVVFNPTFENAFLANYLPNID